jgi:hypothetical protein
MDISHLDWPAHIEGVADSLRTRWPWLRIDISGRQWAAHIEVTARDTSASINLASRVEVSPLCMGPEASVGSTSCGDGSISGLRVLGQEMSAIADAIDAAMQDLRRVTVWQDGYVPCCCCGGRGATRGGKCTHCDGRGTSAPRGE